MPILCTTCMVWNSLSAQRLGIYYPPPAAIAAAVGMNARVAAFAWVHVGTVVAATGYGSCGVGHSSVSSGAGLEACVSGLAPGVGRQDMLGCARRSKPSGAYCRPALPLEFARGGYRCVRLRSPWMDLAWAIPAQEAGRAFCGTANMSACSREELRRQRTIAWK